jgi:hypothetical protein
MAELPKDGPWVSSAFCFQGRSRVLFLGERLVNLIPKGGQQDEREACMQYSFSGIIPCSFFFWAELGAEPAYAIGCGSSIG